VALRVPERGRGPRTRRLAAELLARPDLPTILRRVVTDADDDVRRALDARR
jgi:aminopeptidase N